MVVSFRATGKKVCIELTRHIVGHCNAEMRHRSGIVHDGDEGIYISFQICCRWVCVKWSVLEFQTKSIQNIFFN